jgi:probable addiction module antidote protein
MDEQFTRWDAADYLKTEEDMMRYLEACAEEDSGDGRLIQAALGDIARARSMRRSFLEFVNFESTVHSSRDALSS